MMQRFLAGSALVLTTLAVHAAPNTPLPPVRELSDSESNAALGLPKLTAAQLNLRVAAATAVRAYDKGAPRSAVDRAQGSDVAVYSGLPLLTAPLLPADTSASQPDFQVDRDWGQAWATMTSAGVPHLKAIGYGDFAAEATASWHTTLVIPADGTREVFVKLAVPPARVSGDTEGNHRHKWLSRLRADLLVNGWPAWSTEALRFSANRLQCGTTPQSCATEEDQPMVQFGSPLAFATNDEDGITSNDGENKTLTTQPSARRTVFLTLGRHAAGARIHLSWVLRGRAWSEPKSPGLTDNRCKKNYQLDLWFCSRADMSIAGTAADAPEVRYGP